MAYSQEDIAKALRFAETVKLTATLDESDGKTIQFHRSDNLPVDMDAEVRELLEIAVQYYQRSIFTGEYLMADNEPPVRRSGQPIDDINFFLSYYQTKLIEELKKAFELDDSLNQVSNEEVPKISPFAQVMLDYRKKMANKQQKS
jgi:hypothetical protein